MPDKVGNNVNYYRCRNCKKDWKRSGDGKPLKCGICGSEDIKDFQNKDD